MSFHGGLIGSVLAGFIFCRRRKLPFWELADIVIVTAPVGLFFGRLGNFINGELYGRITSAPWGMIFPNGGPVPRHPSQLYEALLEGVALFLILWAIKDRPLRPGSLICFFLGGYGIIRFFIEFFRAPDAHLGLFYGLFTMGQVLCFAMTLFALLLWVFVIRHNTPPVR
jgi:phosphatidylglycerol:prolipoprotein diacylglycerol transferase